MVPKLGLPTVTLERLLGRKSDALRALGLSWGVFDCEMCSLKIRVLAVQPSRAAATDARSASWRSRRSIDSVDSSLRSSPLRGAFGVQTGIAGLSRTDPPLATISKQIAAAPIRLQNSFQFKSPTKKSVVASIAPKKSSEVSK